PAFAQNYLGNWSNNRSLPQVSPFSPNSITKQYGTYGSPYSPKSANNPYATETPMLFNQQGQYRGNLSSNPYDPNSTSNPYGRYGSQYSPDSINNPHGAGSRYAPDSPNNPFGSGWTIIGR